VSEGDHHPPRQNRALATIDALIAATVAELDAHGELGLRVEAVVERAGTSIGSVYHHFGDKDALIDAARLDQLTRHADDDTAALRSALQSISTHADLMRELPRISTAFQTGALRSLRARRLANLAATLTRPEYAARVAEVQHRVTRDIAAIIDDLKTRSVVADSVDSLAVATFIQAYTVGQVVADVDSDPVPVRRWEHAVLAALRALLPPPQPVGSGGERSSFEQTPHASTTRGQATERALIEAARHQIETRTDADFRVDEIIAEVGVSASSVYHLFGSREGLMEAAWLDWARQNASEDVWAIQTVLENATSPEHAVDEIIRVVLMAQSARRTERRFQRLTVLAAAVRRPGLREEIGRLETETNHRYQHVLDDAKSRGLLRPDLDTRLIPVLVRALSFGRVSNELSVEQVDPDAWDAEVKRILRRLLLGDVD
jgi:AcrR family transcriptional regulator